MVEMNTSLALSDVFRIEALANSMTVSEMAAEVFGVGGTYEIEQMAAICARNGIVPQVRKPEVVTIDGYANKRSLARAGEVVGLPQAPAANDPASRPAVGRTTVAAEEGAPLASSAEHYPVDAEEVMRSASSEPIKYRLRNAAGSFLNLRRTGLTDDLKFAWIGTAKEVEQVLFKERQSTALTVEPVL